MSPHLAAALTAVLLLPAVAAPRDESPAESPPKSTATDLPAQVAALNHPDYATRAAATDALLRNDTLDLGALAAAAGPDLPAETRERLLYVARHHTVRRLRHAHFPADGPGSIGIVQSVLADLPPAPPPQPRNPRDGRVPPEPEAGPPYALVTAVLPGFPACGRLRALDRIVALNGQPIAGPALPSTFQGMLDPFVAGQTLRLTVQRDGATLSVPLTLANRAALSGIYAPPSHTLHPRFADEWDQQRKPFEWPADAAGPTTVPTTVPTTARPPDRS